MTAPDGSFLPASESAASPDAESLSGDSLARRILWQEKDFLVLNKPGGVSLLADRSAGAGPCLWEALEGFCAARGLGRPRLVHRLDKGCEGALLVALSDPAQSHFTRLFTLRRVGKWYLALVRGRPDPPRAIVALPLRAGRKNRVRVAGPRAAIFLDRSTFPPVWRLKGGGAAISEKSYDSVSEYRALRLSPAAGLTALALRLHTGRRHQLRAHLAWLGWPILGDPLYPPRARALDRAAPDPAPGLALQCSKLAFAPPASNRWITVRAPRPAWLAAEAPPQRIP